MVAHFDSRFSDLANFSATIGWGTGPGLGGHDHEMPELPGLGYDVSGTHTYANAGTYATTVAIASARDMTSGTATGTANVTAPRPCRRERRYPRRRIRPRRRPRSGEARRLPGTRRGTRALWRGCADIDLVHGAHGLAGPVLDELVHARGLLGKGRGMGRPRLKISRARGLIERAALALAHGNAL